MNYLVIKKLVVVRKCR